MKLHDINPDISLIEFMRLRFPDHIWDTTRDGFLTYQLRSDHFNRPPHPYTQYDMDVWIDRHREWIAAGSPQDHVRNF